MRLAAHYAPRNGQSTGLVSHHGPPMNLLCPHALQNCLASPESAARGFRLTLEDKAGRGRLEALASIGGTAPCGCRCVKRGGSGVP